MLRGLCWERNRSSARARNCFQSGLFAALWPSSSLLRVFRLPRCCLLRLARSDCFREARPFSQPGLAGAVVAFAVVEVFPRKKPACRGFRRRRRRLRARRGGAPKTSPPARASRGASPAGAFSFFTSQRCARNACDQDGEERCFLLFLNKKWPRRDSNPGRFGCGDCTQNPVPLWTARRPTLYH